MFTTSNNCLVMHAYGKKNSVDEPVCRGGKVTQMWRRDLQTAGEGEGEMN